MSIRKTIAFVVGTGHAMLNSEMVEGITVQAKELGYNLAVISMFALSEENSDFQYGESNIYTLLDNENIVGVIFSDYNIYTQFVKEKVVKLFERFPSDRVVVLDDEDRHGYVGLNTDDIYSMELLTDHMIDVHGCKDVICLTGPLDKDVSKKRLQGFKNSFYNHGLEVKESRIIEGDFWEMAATKLAEDIANGTVEKPDGVICCNYKMTNVLINELAKHDINVPDSFPVVGYDYTGVDALNNEKYATTHIRPEKNLGARCVCYIHKGITGEKAEPYTKEPGRLIIGDSCGCKKRSDFYRKATEESRSNYNYSIIFRNNYMQEHMAICEDLDSLLVKLTNYLYVIRNLCGYDICLNEKWNQFSEDDEYKIVDGYEPRLINVLSSRNFYSVFPNIVFPASQLYPPTINISDKPVVCYFTPLHFGNRCMGYQIAQFNDDLYRTDESVYHQWTSGLCSALEMMRMKAHMKIMYNKVYTSSMRDSMTGLYNRRAFEKFKTDVFERARYTDQKLLVASIDMNNLKQINDTYGHMEGDSAIITLANAINTCCGNNEYGLRVGGDEFIILGCYDYNADTPSYYEGRIKGFLERYNTHSGKPYQVSASVGFYFGNAKEVENIDSCLEIADESMYKNKSEGKKGRQ